MEGSELGHDNNKSTLLQTPREGGEEGLGNTLNAVGAFEFSVHTDDEGFFERERSLKLGGLIVDCASI